LFLYFC